MPKVSIVMPCYNQEQYVEAAVDSVLRQTISDWELIVVDDGSTDGSLAALARCADPRIQVILQLNQERARARNRALREARGEFVAFLDADDLWAPDYLEKQLANFDAQPGLGLSRTFAYSIDASGVVLGLVGHNTPDTDSQRGFLAALLVANRMVNPATVMVRAACLDTVGLFDPATVPAEDWDLWIRIGLRYPMGTVSEPLAYYRHHDSYMPRRLRPRGGDEPLIRIVEKSFAHIDDPELLQLRGKALGYAYWRTAWNCFALHEIDTAQSLLTTARALDPDFFAAPHEELVSSIAYLAEQLYDVATPLHEALACIDNFFDHLPAWASPLLKLRRRAKGQYCGVHVFREYQRLNWRDVRTAAPLAVRSQPRWLLNKGFRSIMARAYLPLWLL